MNSNSITCKKLGHSNISYLTELINVYAAVFETENFTLPVRDYLQTLLDNGSSIFCVALSDNVVVGGLTACVLPSVYYPSSQVYIYDLAVRQDKQRQGVGKKIISFLKDCCTAFGYKEMYVQADLKDQHAIDFYAATGGHAEKVVHFSYHLASLK